MNKPKRFYWLKLQKNFFRQKEIKKLRKIAGGDTYTIIYQEMLLLSVEDEGKLFFEGMEDTFAEELALELDETVENVQMTLAYLAKHNLIEKVSEDEYLMSKTQSMVGSQSESTERVRRLRQKNKVIELESVTCNDDVTDCNPIKSKSKREELEKREKRKELDKEEEKINKKKSFKKWIKDELIAEMSKFPQHQLYYDDFIVYWTEENDKGKMRFQLEKTWSTGGRLSRWAKNNFGKSNFKKPEFDESKSTYYNVGKEI